MKQDILDEFVTKKFTRGRPNDEEIIESNIKAMGLGRTEVKQRGISIGQLNPPQTPDYEQVLMNGNVAICLGAMHAGVNFYAVYSISPATSILVLIE